MPYPDASTGTISSKKEQAYNRQGTIKVRHFRKNQCRAEVLVRRAPLRGLTPEIQEYTNGVAVHPMVLEAGKSRMARMKCIALSGHSDRLRPFPHVL